MQIGYFAVGIGPTVDPEWVRTVATTAERLGFSTIWAPEHVVLLEQDASKYPYSSGDFPAPTTLRSPTPSRHWPMRPPAQPGSGWRRVSVSCPSTTPSCWPRPWRQSTV